MPNALPKLTDAQRRIVQRLAGGTPLVGTSYKTQHGTTSYAYVLAGTPLNIEDLVALYDAGLIAIHPTGSPQRRTLVLTPGGEHYAERLAETD